MQMLRIIIEYSNITVYTYCSKDEQCNFDCQHRFNGNINIGIIIINNYYDYYRTFQQLYYCAASEIK